MTPTPTRARVRLASIVAALAVVIAAGAFMQGPISGSTETTTTGSSITPSRTISVSSSITSLGTTIASSSRTMSTETITTTTETTRISSSAVRSTAEQNKTVQIVLPLDVGANESLNFQPARIGVVIGVNNTIVWKDLDGIQHTVKSTSVPPGAKPFYSGIMNQGQSFTVTLTVPGLYKYDCSIHPDWMVGSIQVVA
jgi:plastocyanin